MKKIKLFLLLCFITAKIQAQPYVSIPDPVFRDYIDSLVPGAIVGNNLNTSHPGLQNITVIDVRSRGIYDLTGVQYFPLLSELLCGDNYLSALPPLPYWISALGCERNQISSLPSLPSNLGWLSCDHNQLSSLPALPPNVWELICFNNNLTTLPSLPQNLANIWASDCQLTSLPPLPPNLLNLSCENNMLTSLPTLPNSLTNLQATGNPDLWCLPNIPNNGSFYSDIGFTICTPQGTPDAWYKMADLPVTDRESATSFSIGSQCYFATGGSNSGKSNDLWAFNPASNVWTQQANLPAAARIQATSFSIGNKGYVGLGQGDNPAVLRDFWEYNPTANAWIQKADYPDSAYFGNAAFSIGSKGYVGCGERSGYVFPNTFFEFDPVANTWTPKANFPGLGRTQSACFTIGNRGYVCGGDWANGLTNSCYSYNPSTNSWSSVATLPYNINQAASFSTNGKGYVSCGQCCYWNGQLLSNLMEYDPVLNSWTQRADLPTTGRFSNTGCAAGGRCYAGTGVKYSLSGNYTKTNDWWEYTPLCTKPSKVIYASGNTALCNGDSVMLFADNGNKYKWKMNGVAISGATSQFYYAKTAGTFTCVISNSCDTVASYQIVTTVNPLPSALITPGGPTTFCSGDSVTLNAPVAANRSYQWKKGGNLIAGATLSSYTATTGGNYKVTVTNTVTGCSKTKGSATVVSVNTLPSATITPQGPTTFCAGGSVVLAANTGTGLTYKWKKGANYIGSATSSTYTATLAGTYKVEVTKNNGCSKLSGGVTVTVPCREGEILSENSFDIKVFPNPNSGEFTIEFSDKPTSPVQIQLTDETGRVVKKFETLDETLKIKESNLTKGIYCLIATNKDRVVIKKINILK